MTGRNDPVTWGDLRRTVLVLIVVLVAMRLLGAGWAHVEHWLVGS